LVFSQSLEAPGRRGPRYIINGGFLETRWPPKLGREGVGNPGGGRGVVPTEKTRKKKEKGDLPTGTTPKNLPGKNNDHGGMVASTIKGEDQGSWEKGEKDVTSTADANPFSFCVKGGGGECPSVVQEGPKNNEDESKKKGVSRLNEGNQLKKKKKAIFKKKRAPKKGYAKRERDAIWGGEHIRDLRKNHETGRGEETPEASRKVHHQFLRGTHFLGNLKKPGKDRGGTRGKGGAGRNLVGKLNLRRGKPRKEVEKSFGKTTALREGGVKTSARGIGNI